MNKTPYSTNNGSFSNSAHLSAQKLIYPQFLQVPFENLTFTDTLVGMSKRASILDGDMAIDRIVKITALPIAGQKLKLPLPLTIQERFRRPDAIRFKDITITEWNKESDKPSELYKLAANYFVYGYFDISENEFLDAIVINVPILIRQMCRGHIKYEIDDHNPRSNQSFLTIAFDVLARSGCVAYWQSKRKKQ